MPLNKKLKEKIQESLSAVLPITLIVIALCVTITPMPLAPLMLFLAGAALLIVGMGLFTLGADMAMMPIGELVGGRMAKGKRLGIIALLCFFIGGMVTMAEPDLKVLAHQMPGVPDLVLMLSVACGVGIFLAVSFLRTLFGWRLSTLLLGCYGLIFLLALFVPREFLAVAFDSGGVTTGPMTVPFIMALGLGLAALGKSRQRGEDSFGMIALCSVGPILAVLVLGLTYRAEGGSYEPFIIPEINSTRELGLQFGAAFPTYMKEVLGALLPIMIFFLVFQVLFLRLRKRQMGKILVGLLYTFAGLTLFLTGVNIGFMPVGHFLGAELAGLSYRWVLVPLGMVIGYFIVKAEPAVLVLNKQVEDITSGAIPQRMMMAGLSMGMALSVGLSMLRVLTGLPLLALLLPGYVEDITSGAIPQRMMMAGLSMGMALSVGLSMLRVLTGLPLLALLLPGYVLALGLSFVVPPMFTAIAFDSGGVASGPMTATFLLPLAMGACEAVQGNMLQDAFGIVAMVAMTPLVMIQLIGLIYRIKTAGLRQRPSQPPLKKETDELIALSEEDAAE